MSCDICKKPYSIIWRRESKCKRCGRSMCSDCSKLQQVREVFRCICKVCMQDSETIRKTISDSLLAWNHNSEIAKKFWVKDIEFAKKTYNINKTIQCQQIARDVKTVLQTPMNYSIQDFYDLLHQNVKDVESITILVVDTFVTRNPKVGYNQYLIKLAIFLLCFSKDYACIKIMEDIYGKIPKQYHPNYQISPEFIADHDQMQHDAIQDVKFRFKLEQEQIIAAKHFIESAMMHYKNQFFLNLSFQCAFYIIDKIIQSQDATEIDKYFSVIIKININQLHNSELMVARHTSLEDIKQYSGQVLKKRSSLYLSVDKCNNQELTSRTQRNVSEFEVDDCDSKQSTSLLQFQKQEISRLTQELLLLEQQINKLKLENQQLEENCDHRTTHQLFQEYETAVSHLIDQTETLLKMTMSN